MRKVHPNAFKPWTATDDKQLKKAYASNQTLTAMAEQFGRHEGSIKARLKKHFGDDAVIPHS
jgi:hypothetical protein